jgi:hypothetical protein
MARYALSDSLGKNDAHFSAPAAISSMRLSSTLDHENVARVTLGLGASALGQLLTNSPSRPRA